MKKTCVLDVYRLLVEEYDLDTVKEGTHYNTLIQVAFLKVEVYDLEILIESQLGRESELLNKMKAEYDQKLKRISELMNTILINTNH